MTFFFFLTRYYGIVQLIPIFQYSNMYAVNPALRELATNLELCKECISYVAKSGKRSSE